MTLATNNIGMNILSIIVFILCLSVVVTLHELGHFSMAKLFNVYCQEFSIGFGPALYKHKFKHKIKKGTLIDESKDTITYKETKNGTVAYKEGETEFCIRALPLGGYVAMAEDDSRAESDARMIVPKERTVEGVNHFKQICIMMAGVLVNLLLAWVLLFSCYAFCKQQRYVYEKSTVNVSEKIDDKDSLAYRAGLRSGDYILKMTQSYHNLVTLDELSKGVTGSKTIDFGGSDITSYLEFNDGKTSGQLYDYASSSLVYQSQDIMSRRYDVNYKGNESKYFQGEFEPFKDYYANNNSYRELHITYLSHEDNSTKVVDIRSDAKKVSDNDITYYTFEKIGISPVIEKYKVSNPFMAAGSDFNNLFVNIYVALGSIFTPQGWSQVGGIISVYKVSAAGFQSGSVGYFLKLWGYISLNLACFNLLPFPGLDGWQTLLALIESIIRKKIPPKVKYIANTIGLFVLLALAGVLIIKDLVRPAAMIKLLF